MKDKSVPLLKNEAKKGPGNHRDENPRALHAGEWQISSLERFDSGATNVDDIFPKSIFEH